MRQKSNLVCITSKQIHTSNCRSISEGTAKKSSENWFWTKGNNSCKNRSNVTRVELDLYYLKRNTHTKFQVNISKDSWEKSGKLSGRTDRQTDTEETYSPPGFTGRGLIRDATQKFFMKGKFNMALQHHIKFERNPLNTEQMHSRTKINFQIF